MKISMQSGLPFVAAVVCYKGRELPLANVLVDTGSASTIISEERLRTFGLTFEPNDPIHPIRGVGGAEFVFAKTLVTVPTAARLAASLVVERETT
ncbi:MAG: hypothetical protein ACLQVD_02955 [Capsulimonadaceae bacterium]